MEQKRVTVAELVAAFQREGGEMTVKTYYRLARGVFPVPESGKINGVEAAVRIAAYYESMRTRKDEAPTWTDERARLIKATADLKELELRKTEGSLLSTGEAEYLWSGIMEPTRARLMTVPEEMADLVKCATPREAEAVARAIINRVLTELGDPSLKAVVAAAELKPKKEDTHNE